MKSFKYLIPLLLIAASAFSQIDPVVKLQRVNTDSLFIGVMDVKKKLDSLDSQIGTTATTAFSYRLDTTGLSSMTLPILVLQISGGDTVWVLKDGVAVGVDSGQIPIMVSSDSLGGLTIGHGLNLTGTILKVDTSLIASRSDTVWALAYVKSLIAAGSADSAVYVTLTRLIDSLATRIAVRDSGVTYMTPLGVSSLYVPFTGAASDVRLNSQSITGADTLIAAVGAFGGATLDSALTTTDIHATGNARIDGYVGIGKARQYGVLDINGEMYSTVGYNILSYNSSLLYNYLTLYGKARITSDVNGNLSFSPNLGVTTIATLTNAGYFGLSTTTPYHLASGKSTGNGICWFNSNYNTVYNSATQEADTGAARLVWLTGIGWRWVMTDTVGSPDTTAVLSDVDEKIQNSSLGVGSLTAGEKIYSAGTDSVYSRRDTLELFIFGAGGGNAWDTTSFTTDSYYGSFDNDTDTLNIISMTVRRLGTSDTCTVDVMWDDSLGGAGAVHLNTTPFAVTSSGAKQSDASFDNSQIPPGVCVWMETPTLVAGRKPTYLAVTIHGWVQHK